MFRCLFYCVRTAILDEITPFAVLNPSDRNFKLKDAIWPDTFFRVVQGACPRWVKIRIVRGPLKIRCSISGPVRLSSRAGNEKKK